MIVPISALIVTEECSVRQITMSVFPALATKRLVPGGKYSNSMYYVPG